jgi:beta-galactosidase
MIFLDSPSMRRHLVVRSSFNAQWTVKPKQSIFAQLGDPPDSGTRVTLPHDAMLTFVRSPNESDGPQSGYFPGGAVEYAKAFDAPNEWRRKRVSVEFQGVYRDAMVFVNGAFAGQRPNGYSTFRVALDPFLRFGALNTIRVEARAYQDSRWYSGLGIHRDTVLMVTGLAHVAVDGVRVSTPDVDDERAVVEVATTVENDSTETQQLRVATDLQDAAGHVVASDTSPVTVRAGAFAVVRQRMYVRDAATWSVDSPYLYRAVTRLRNETEEVDTAVVPFGIRTIRVDPFHGLRVNGKTVKLRGACLHHDNGLLGAAAIARAEERRIEILRAAGFNAIRSAHNPISPAMLDACDRLGMLVMDEAFDMWTESKNAFDYSLAFPEWWERDIESMVAKDYNHPSVIMYSIGNEILDTGNAHGSAWGRAIAEKVRTLDETRFITNGISGFVSTISENIDAFQEQVGELRSRGGVNDLMSEMSELFNRISLSDVVTEKTAESHAVVDIVGHNYAEARYLADREAFPNRVVVGTETLANRIDVNWRLVTENPHVIGDCTWTGWDYLGEAGIGRTEYVDDAGLDAPGPVYPWLLAWCGDIDITGYRRPASYYRETVFGLRHEPYIAVRRPEGYGRRAVSLDWAWSDSIGSWSWDIEAGTRIEVEVYSNAEEVELLLNRTRVGAMPAGPEHRYRAVFDLAYEPGELVAVARSGGAEIARTVLRSASRPVSIRASADRHVLRADDTDLAFVAIELVDARGTLATSQDRAITVEVTGAGVLQAFGSARPVTEERFDAPTHTTFDGRVLAVVRPTGVGEITMTITCDGLEPAAIVLRAEAIDAVAA